MKKVIDELKRALDEFVALEEKLNGSGVKQDIADVGNFIGIALGKAGVTCESDDLQHFFHGVEHGVSLEDGSHDAPPSPEEQERIDKLNEEFRNEWLSRKK